MRVSRIPPDHTSPLRQVCNRTRSRSAAFSCLSSSGPFIRPPWPGPARDRVRMRLPDAVGRSELRIRIEIASGCVGADDGGARCIQSRDLTQNTR